MVHFHKKCYHFLIAFFTCIFLSVQAGMSQYYLIGTEPSSVKWSQIKTPNFKVIYPRIWEREGQYVANGLEYVYQPGSRTMYQSTPKTPVILHNQTTVPTFSNIYSAKKDGVLYNTPPQDMYPQDWVDQLIIHEFRHAVQYSAVNCGFTKGLYYILGEQGVFGILVYLYLCG